MRKPSSKSLHKKAWKLHSEYVRRYEKGICYTCGDSRYWKSQQAGHYIHKDCLDFDPINIHCQCVRCNKWLHGNAGAYAERLIKEYGIDAVDYLRLKSNQVHKFTIEELQAYIIYFEIELSLLDKKEVDI